MEKELLTAKGFVSLSSENSFQDISTQTEVRGLNSTHSNNDEDNTRYPLDTPENSKKESEGIEWIGYLSDH
jgi:hypothetical protein